MWVAGTQPLGPSPAAFQEAEIEGRGWDLNPATPKWEVGIQPMTSPRDSNFKNFEILTVMDESMDLKGIW